MDDAYAIRSAKTEFRDGYNRGDVERILSIFAEGFSDMSAGLPSFYGAEAPAVMRHRLTRLFSRFRAKMTVTIISIGVEGNLAFDWGWHQLTLTPKKGGRARTVRTRYLEIWTKGPEGRWKIAIFFDNADLPPEMPPREVMQIRSGRLPDQADRRNAARRRTAKA